jgi:hypothetical protein
MLIENSVDGSCVDIWVFALEEQRVSLAKYTGTDYARMGNDAMLADLLLYRMRPDVCIYTEE